MRHKFKSVLSELHIFLSVCFIWALLRLRAPFKRNAFATDHLEEVDQFKYLGSTFHTN